MLLAAVSNSAAAAWVMLSESEAAVVYVDPATIQRTENRAILLELTDYRIVPDPKHPYQSAKRSYQFDCVEGALRTLSIVTFSGKMGGGEIVLAINEPKFCGRSHATEALVRSHRPSCLPRTT